MTANQNSAAAFNADTT